MIKAPVVMFVFIRPSSTKLFLDLIKESGTETLYIFADQGRNKLEQSLASEVKMIIQQFVIANPSIKIMQHYAINNLGLKKNIVDGLNQVFTQEDRAIIIEDDCLPHPDFFLFANEMLEKYNNENKIMSVNGTSVGNDGDCSYDFTRYSQCWGWATWKRAWDKYDINMKSFNTSRWHQKSCELWGNPISRWYWQHILTLVKANWIKTWDFQWSFAHLISGGLAISPKVNLIENIGFDIAATNTKTKSSVANMKTRDLDWPLIHPLEVVENLDITSKIEQRFYNNPIAILGMLRQYIYWKVSNYAHRS